MENERPLVSTTQTSFRIIETIRDNPGLGVSALARRVDLSKSAVHKHVSTLVEINYLVREGNEYYLSNRFLSLGNRARERLPLNVAAKLVNDLAETTGHTTMYMVPENDRGVYTFCSSPHGETPDDISEGEVVPLHATAGGKAILSFYSKDRQDSIIQSTGLTQYTDKTITDERKLKRELQSIRDQRVAYDREEYLNGQQCVASPVIKSNGEPVAAVSVTGSTQRMSGKHLEVEVAGLVASAAKSVGNELLSR